MTKDISSAPSGTGSREPDPQAVPALTGFDPSRVAASLTEKQARALLAMPLSSYRSGHGAGTLVSLKHEHSGTNYGVARPALASAVHENRYSKRYTLTEEGEQVTRLLRDSDEHRNGEDPEGLSGEAMPARAGTASPNPNRPGQEEA